MKIRRRRALIISYYWPPAGGPGVQRWLKFSTYLPETGWDPTVYIPSNPSYPILDHSLEKEISPEVKILRHPILEPYSLAEKLNPKNKKYKSGQFDIGKNQNFLSKLSIWVRGNFFIPDARVLWVNPSIRYLKKLISEENFDVVITTGPPHSVHLIGLGLKKHFPNLPWVADFRDPWTQISYHRHLKLSRWADRKHHQLEKKVLTGADVVLATSYSDAKAFQNYGANSYTITNGFDGEYVRNNSPKNSSVKKFTYAGVLEQLRNPKGLWEAFENLFDENPALLDAFELHFVGKVDEEIQRALSETNFAHAIHYHGYLSHQESYQSMCDADALLITNFPEAASAGIIPGKIFEYLSTGKLIISIGPEKADVEKILEETGTGKHFRHDEVSGLQDFLREWLSGKIQYQPQPEKINSFTRKHLTKELASILNRLA